MIKSITNFTGVIALVGIITFFVYVHTGDLQDSDIVAAHTAKPVTTPPTAPKKTRLALNKPAVPPIHVDKGTYVDNMLLAYRIASDVGVPPVIVQSILIIESNGGRARSLSYGGAYGLMQVKVEAARSVLRHYPSIAIKYFNTASRKRISDHDIKRVLLSNREANIHIACAHLYIYNNLLDGIWEHAVAAYNMGIGNALKSSSLDDNQYLQTVLHHANTTVLAFNDNHNLQ